jgi:hypothetical protein
MVWWRPMMSVRAERMRVSVRLVWRIGAEDRTGPGDGINVR